MQGRSLQADPRGRTPQAELLSLVPFSPTFRARRPHRHRPPSAPSLPPSGCCCYRRGLPPRSLLPCRFPPPSPSALGAGHYFSSPCPVRWVPVECCALGPAAAAGYSQPGARYKNLLVSAAILSLSPGSALGAASSGA